MIRLLLCLFAAGFVAGCMHAPANAHEDCHLESGWLDATNGCSARAGYPDCQKVCADGSRERVGTDAPSTPAPATSSAAPPN
jgi:hypothetical protein